MHSSEAVPAPTASGPNLLLQLGRLIIRARSTSPVARAPPHDRLLHAKLLAAKPSTSKQVQSQPKPEVEEPKTALEAQLSDHVLALWNEQIPICIEVLLAPQCSECYASLGRMEEDASYDKLHCQQRALLLERWTMRALVNKTHGDQAFITSQWLLNAVRSQLHFSQLAAWRATITDDNRQERRRKLSRETCNYKKMESNCDENDLSANEETRKLNIVYSIKIPGESYKMADFARPPTDHTFPITDIGSNVSLKVVLQSLPRIDEIPTVQCSCPKRRNSKESSSIYEELSGKLSDLTLGPRVSRYGTVSPDSSIINSNIGTASRRLSIISNPGSTEFLFSSAPEKKDNNDQNSLLDDRMHTPCSENGKHKCNCDDESDGKENHRSSISLSPQETKKLDERRLKEIAKYKRRLRKESKLKKHSDSTSSEGEGLKTKETHTSIPILQAARFDRFRAIGCYRNQTYLTLPASRIELKSPFVDSESLPPPEYKKTNSIGTQTEDLACQCGRPLSMKCEGCSDRGMVRSEANYNLASVGKGKDDETGARRKLEEDSKVLKKHKCDNSRINIKCDNYSIVNDRFSASFKDTQSVVRKCNEEDGSIIKRPKLRRFFPIVDKIEKIVTDRFSQKDKDIEDLNLKNDDTVFLSPNSQKRQKTYSINEDDYVLYEKCDYGTIDNCDIDSPIDVDNNGFKFPDSKKGQDNQVPSPTEMDRFRWRFDSAASMVFHSKTGLPLTSSPAPVKRGNNCFGFDDSINGITGIKSALFHPISPVSPTAAPPSSPATPVTLAPLPRQTKKKTPRLKIGPSTGLLGSFEESALKGRLEPVATVHGFTAELGASGAFCPPHKRLPVTVFFYAPGGTNAPYMGHINLGSCGYRVSRSGTIQVSLFNPHGTLVKMFVVLYDLTSMPPLARTFLRQRTLYLPAGVEAPPTHNLHKWLRYLIHLRFMTSKSGKLYLHTDIRIIVSRKADVDTATAHSALFPPNNQSNDNQKQSNSNQIPSPSYTEHCDKSHVNKEVADQNCQGNGVKSIKSDQHRDHFDQNGIIYHENDKGILHQNESVHQRVNGTTHKNEIGNTNTNQIKGNHNQNDQINQNRSPNRVFGGCSSFDANYLCYDNPSGVSYELRSFTYAPENPKYSPR